MARGTARKRRHTCSPRKLLMLRKKHRSGAKPRGPRAADRNPLNLYMASFLDWSASRGLSHQTVETRESALRRFIADIRYIQAILGHSDLDTTAIYTQVSIHKLKEIHAATHPAKM
jgi:integrase